MDTERAMLVRTALYAATPAEYAAYIKSEVAKWAKAVKDSGARVD